MVGSHFPTAQISGNRHPLFSSVSSPPIFSFHPLHLSLLLLGSPSLFSPSLALYIFWSDLKFHALATTSQSLVVREAERLESRVSELTTCFRGSYMSVCHCRPRNFITVSARERKTSLQMCSPPLP